MKTTRENLTKIGVYPTKPFKGPIHKEMLVGKRWAQIVKGSGHLGTATDYAAKYYKMSQDLNAIDQALMTPELKGLAQSLTTLSHVMAAFGDNLPLFGSLIKAYGDLTIEMTKITLALDAKIEERENGQLIDGVHGERGTMLDQLRKLGISDAQRVDGTRDVFRGADGRLLIWDRKGREWVIADDHEPGITEEEIIKRYLFFTTHGTPEPTPEQIVRGYRRAVVLELVPSTTHVAPNGTVTLRVIGRRPVDNKEITDRELYAKVTLAGHTGIGIGELRGDRVKLGGTTTWVAPNNLNERYTFTADLDEDTAKVAISGGAVTATVRTGTETQIELTTESTEVAASTPVELTAVLLTADGNRLPATVAGSLDLVVDPPLGYFTDWVALADYKGTRHTWMAPDQAGTYTVTARYGGSTGHGLFADHSAGSTATLKLVVGKAGEPDAGIDAPPGDAGDDEPDAAPIDAPSVAATDAAPLDWPGTWRGPMKTTVELDGVRHVQDETLELVVTRSGGKLVLSKPGFEPVVATPTPSNPNAASATFTVPKPNVGVGGAVLTAWDAGGKWTVFLAAGKLNIALEMTVKQTIQSGDQVKHSTMVTRSIGQLDKIK